MVRAMFFVSKEMKILAICLGDEGNRDQDLWREFWPYQGFHSRSEIPDCLSVTQLFLCL